MFSLLVAMGMLFPSHLPAQGQSGRLRGLFGEIDPTEPYGLMGRKKSKVGGYFTGQGNGASSGRIGGLFGETDPIESYGLMGRAESMLGGDFTGQGFGATGAEITGQTFGAPLGSGLFVMLAAGAGYATMKSKKKQNKQNRKEK